MQSLRSSIGWLVVLALVSSGCAYGRYSRHQRTDDGEWVQTEREAMFSIGHYKREKMETKPTFTLPEQLFSLNLGPKVN